jgi:radical SAM enzyme (TIGR01210 family)
VTTAYPTQPSARTRWITAARGPKNRVDPARTVAAIYEEETGPHGDAVPTATLFLANTECPWRCLMCDLWRDTLDAPTPPGAVPRQITAALADLPPVRQVKLYNAGSFFDDRAIPPEDDAAIAELMRPYERVIVECHPALIGDRCLRFQDMLPGTLEVAIGLETVHPKVLAKLNKRITVEDFRRAADLLAQNEIALRVFLLLKPPFMTGAEGVEWACRSLDVSFDAGASVCCVIPTRAGNGAMEQLEAMGTWAKPSIADLERVQEYGIGLRRGRVFADVWDIEKFYTCACSEKRAERIGEMNRWQEIVEGIRCDSCLELGLRGLMDYAEDQS